jgi:subtilisin family serine protease
MGAGPQGVVGAAHGCRLMSVRMTRLATDGQLDVTDAQLMADAIRWAADNGADVISFSWDAGWSMPALAAAIRHARSNGRGGLGCVIVAAAGNRGIGMVDYPAREDGVLAVAAVGPDDEPVEDACAGDGRQWGSNWGPELAVAAPGLWLRTTDNRGGNGVAAGDYSEDFGGTSAATPLVAAACALILCRNPGLRESEVRAIICNSADKVGSWTYDNSGHSRGLGYGRLNLGQALTMTPTP